MSKYVPGIGPSTAKLAVIGEAPGGDEEDQGLPFVGKTGQIVNRLLDEVGTSRAVVYMTNVVKVRPPGNDIKKLHLIGRKIEDFTPQMWAEIEALQPNCILALGNTALEALTGHRGIEKYRGSVMVTNRNVGYTPIKVVPSLHPASLLHAESEDGKLRSWKDITFIRWDFEKALRQSISRQYNPVRRNLIVARSSRDLWSFFNRNKHNRYVTVDIETMRTIPICIGFAFSPFEAISVPLFHNLDPRKESFPRSDLPEIWKIVSQFLINPFYQKIGQNYRFDSQLTERCLDRTCWFGMPTRGFFFDTQLAFRTLYPELPAKLEFIASVLTDEVYWKEEGKGYNPKKDSLDRLLLYNAKDAAVTFECYLREMEELEETGLDKFFFEEVMPLHPFYSRVEQRGILLDREEQKRLSGQYRERDEQLTSQLKTLLDGEEINPNSHQQVATLLYSFLQIPARKDTSEETLDALIRNTVRDPKKQQIIQLILDIRKVRKTRGTYVDCVPHHDGRVRTSVNIALETGRTSTRTLKPPITTKPMGLAFQTLTKHGDIGSDLRQIFVPDPGYILIEPDLSQAEARVVAVLADDEVLVKIFKFGVDIHRITAGWLFSKCPDLNPFLEEEDPSRCIEWARVLNKELKALIDEEFERQMGKKFRHAGHYDMGKHEASKQAGISEYKAGKILERFHDANPKIRAVFHAGIRECLEKNDRKLRNPFGRIRQFLDRWGASLFKEAYAQIPQSTVSDQTKQAARKLEKYCPWFQVLQESHDSFLGIAPVDKADKTFPIIKELLETPINFKLCSLVERNVDLVIPCEIKIGEKNWKEMKKIL